MAKKKRRKISKDELRIPAVLRSKYVFFILASVLVAAGAFAGVRYFFLNSSFFNIKKVVINAGGGISFDEIKTTLKDTYNDRNIFTVDLRHTAALIISDFPQIKTVEIRRHMPDSLQIDILPRKPVAVIETAGGIMIDRDGVVLSLKRRTNDLVKINGVSFFLRKPAPGEKIDSDQVSQALSLIELLKRDNVLGYHRVKSIDVSDKRNLSLDIDNVNVKMGSGAFGRKTGQLKKMLNDPKVNMKGLDYIDLRFDEPVLSPK